MSSLIGHWQETRASRPRQRTDCRRRGGASAAQPVIGSRRRGCSRSLAARCCPRPRSDAAHWPLMAKPPVPHFPWPPEDNSRAVESVLHPGPDSLRAVREPNPTDEHASKGGKYGVLQMGRQASADRCASAAPPSPPVGQGMSPSEANNAERHAKRQRLSAMPVRGADCFQRLAARMQAERPQPCQR